MKSKLSTTLSWLWRKAFLPVIGMIILIVAILAIVKQHQTDTFGITKDVKTEIDSTQIEVDSIK